MKTNKAKSVVEFEEPNERILGIRDLRVDFATAGRTVHAVSGVDLDLTAGEILGIVGESGSGKSTLLRAIIGLLPRDVAKGSIQYQGMNLLSLSRAEMRKIAGAEISMVFQDPMTHLNPLMRVYDQIDEALRRHTDASRSERRSRILDTMQMVGIANPESRLSDYPHQFSGGMRQRVLIAMVLACGPRILLADEPTTALDVTVQDQILKLIKRLRDTLGMTVAIVTHDLAVVAQTCDRVCVMYAGEIVESAPVRDLIERPSHPYTLGLMKALPDASNTTRHLTQIPGSPPDLTQAHRGCRFADRCQFVEDACRTWDTQMLEIYSEHLARCRRHSVVEGYVAERYIDG